MLSRLFSGPDADHGRGHAVTAVGDPNQAIYGWRGASVSNILHFADTFPAADGGDVPVLPADRQPPLRPADPRGRQPARRSRSTTEYAGRSSGCAASPSAGRGRRRDARCFETQRRRAGLAGRRGRRGARRRRAWSDIGVLTRDNAHAADVFDALTARRHPGRDRRPLRAAPAARGGRGRGHAAPAPRRHRQRRAAHPAHRSALGDRPARPAAARPAGRRARGRRRPRARPRRSPTSWSRSPTASTRPRSPRSATRSTDPATRRTRPRRSSGSRCSPPSCGCCARTSASRCSTSSAGSSTPPASTSSWPPRSARPPPPGATTSTCS